MTQFSGDEFHHGMEGERPVGPERDAPRIGNVEQAGQIRRGGNEGHAPVEPPERLDVLLFAVPLTQRCQQFSLSGFPGDHRQEGSVDGYGANPPPWARINLILGKCSNAPERIRSTAVLDVSSR